MSSLFDISVAVWSILAAVASGAAPGPVSADSESAAYQFTEQSWLAAVKACAAAGGPASRGFDLVFRTSGGRYYVPIDVERRALQARRAHPEAAATITACYARRNQELLSAVLKRSPSEAELYLAHLAGAEATARLIHARLTKENSKAAHLVRDISERGLPRGAVDRPLTVGNLWTAIERAVDAARQRHAAAGQRAERPALKGELVEGLFGLGRRLADASPAP